MAIANAKFLGDRIKHVKNQFQEFAIERQSSITLLNKAITVQITLFLKRRIRKDEVLN